jgi:hypothetical protein
VPIELRIVANDDAAAIPAMDARGLGVLALLLTLAGLVLAKR